MEKLDLQKIREEIDIIDGELAHLFEKRMDIVLKVAEYKKQNNLPVKDKAREEKILAKCETLVENKEYAEGLKKILRDIMDFSCDIQEKELKKDKIKFGLLGKKLGHSISPKIHKEIFKNLNIDEDYSLIELDENQIENFFKNEIKNYRGLNVTIPYKIKVMEFMDEISKEARDIGAINTIFQKDGKLYGYNTDYFGFKRMLEENKIFVSEKNSVVLGAGGGARAVIKYLIDENAKNILIVARNLEKAKKELEDLVKDRDNINFMDFENFEKREEEGYLIVNCTPVGMYPNIDDSPISKNVSKKYENSVDLIYNPSETKFLKYAKSSGKKSVNGLYMLVAQAVEAEEIWQERKISNEVIKNIMKEKL